MLQVTTTKRENLPGIALVGSVVAATVWLVLYRLGLDDTGLKVVITGLIVLLTVLFYSDQVASGLDELLYGPNYNPQVLTAESRRAKGRWRYSFLPNWKRMHAKRTAFGQGCAPRFQKTAKAFSTGRAACSRRRIAGRSKNGSETQRRCGPSSRSSLSRRSPKLSSPLRGSQGSNAPPIC